METDYVIRQSIKKMSKMYNYFDSRIAIKTLSSLSEKEKEEVLKDSKVQNVILAIDDAEVLREIFRKSPAFFQEVIFSKESLQDKLISPVKTLTRKKLLNIYPTQDYYFPDELIRKIQVFLRTIKSPKVRDQVVDNKFFQTIIALCNEKQISKKFFDKFDIVRLYNNMVNDPFIYDTKISRKRHMINIFNNISNHLLLPEDFQKVISNKADFALHKRWNFRDEEKIYIDENALNKLTDEMIVILLDAKNVDQEPVKNFLQDRIIDNLNEPNCFEKLFSNLNGVSRASFDSLNYLYIKIILEQSEEIKQRYVGYLYNILIPDIELSQEEIILLKQTLSSKILTNSISKEDYNSLLQYPSSLKTLFYLKFGKIASRMDYLYNIDLRQIMYLNVRHINQIINKLNTSNEDELSAIYSIAIKIYFTFGLEKSLKILNNDYGQIDRTFLDNISKLDIRNINIKQEGSKYIPIIREDFMKFMFANPKNNHFINMLNDKKSPLYLYWNYLFNNFDELKEKCHNDITLKKLNVILKELSPTCDISDVSPDNYKLKENDILNDVCLGNKTKCPNEQIYQDLLKIYKQMKNRVTSSIPYVKGTCSNGYHYEMMKLDDPIAFVLGYKGNCCIRVDDIGHDHLLHATLCQNGRILIIYNENNEVAAFSPLKRNGEVLIANSIECAHLHKDETAIETFEEAIKDIVNTSLNNKEEQTPIKLVCIGRGAYAKPAGTPFPENIPTPTILEKDDEVYHKTDCYHKKLDIIYKHQNLNLKNLKYGDPSVKYYDERPKMRSCDFHDSPTVQIEEAYKIINAIRYRVATIEELENFKVIKAGIKKCLYNEDWFVLINYRGEIYHACLNIDPRGIKEYQVALEEFKTYLNSQEIQANNLVTKKLKP